MKKICFKNMKKADGMVKYLEDLHMLEENIEMMEVQILQSYQQKIKMGK